MGSFYNGKWIKIQQRLNEIKSPSNQIEYLLIERRDFVDANTIDDVDARHFLMKLDNEIEVINIREKSIARTEIKAKPKLSLRMVALLHVYDHNLENINRANAQQIIEKYGFLSKTSGEGLYHYFSFYSSRANRRGWPNPPTIIRLKNKIKLFQSVIELLPENCKSDAKADLDHLSSLLNIE